MKYQDRFKAYAKAHKLSPAKMLEHDKQKYPDGCMGGYMRWIDQQIRAFKQISPGSFLGESLVGQKGFTNFLKGVAKK